MDSYIKESGIDSVFLYQSLSESTDDYIYIGNIETNQFFVTQNMVDDFMLPDRLVDNLVGVWGEFVHEKDKERYFLSIDDMLTGKTDYHNLEYQIQNREGRYIWVQCKGMVKRDLKTGSVKYFSGVIRNLEENGKVDFITGLYTHDECRHEFERLVSQGVVGGMMVLNIDNFSSLNTIYGHAFGDSVLRNTAQDIQALLPEDASLYRFDGDQYAIIYTDADRQTIENIYDAIRSYAMEKHTVEDCNYRFTLSAGAAFFNKDAGTWEEIEPCTALAMKVAKAEGRDKCIFYSSGMLDGKIREESIVNILRECVSDDFKGFFLLYQPITKASTLEIVGAEVLLRFENEKYGVLSPVEFIPMLEENNLIIPVGKWVLKQALNCLKSWISHIPDFVMNINVSYLQLLDERFCGYLEQILEETAVDPKHVVIELTESYFVTDADRIDTTLKRLQEQNIRMAMDDFGTGYSSLGRLTQFDVNIVKIDRLFVKSLNENQYNYDFVEAVIRLCHNAGMSVCIEGVETREDQKGVDSLYADTLQGFYISRPVPANVFYERFVLNPLCMMDMV